MRRNNVRGPTSALTEFLRESGITPTTIARRRATRVEPEQPEAGPSQPQEPTHQEADAQEEEENDAPRSKKRSKAGYDSEELDEPEQAPKKKQKMSMAAEAKAKAKAKAAAKRNAEEEEDAYTMLSKSVWTNVAKPPVGSFETCAKCDKQFTVTKYTVPANPGPGFLCHPCVKSAGIDPFKKPAAPKKRKVPVDKRVVTHFEERVFPTLANLCIQIVTRHINDIEVLGDIGSMNLESIAKALSKNRSLNPENVHLFYSITHQQLRFFDATNLNSASLSTLAHLNPNLTTLRLDFCGCLDDAAIATWSNSFPSLTRLELFGPFLVRVPAWISFFEGHPLLQSFLITQSPRFDVSCVKALIENCPRLSELRLQEIGKMSDEFLVEIAKLGTQLTYLDLAKPTKSCGEAALEELLEVAGQNLTHLDLSSHDSITDGFLVDAIMPQCSLLSSLILNNLPELTDTGVGLFFNDWSGKSLHSLSLGRNPSLGSEALKAIVNHSGNVLQELNINGWKNVSEASLSEIAVKCPSLRQLDVGWCREVDDFVVKSIMDGCPDLKIAKVWGCNKLSLMCPKRKGVSLHGVEFHSVT